MRRIKQKTIKALELLRTVIENSPWSDRYRSPICELLKNFDEPCVLAIAGRVKTGKSSFVNAFLKQDLALVGITETTATINYFRYGKPPDARLPVRCAWDDGRVVWEGVDFLNSLQGTSVEALKKAACIKRLEFYVDNPILERVVLVDTPGIGAVTEDNTHEARTTEFFQIRRALRERHSKETESLAANADALIYLTDHVVQQCDAEFLDAFQKKTRAGADSGTSINTLVVMGQADMNAELLETPERATKYVQHESEQLNRQLETPLPLLTVSAGIERALDRLGIEGLTTLRATLRKYFDEEDLDLALEAEENFLNLEIAPDFPVEERYRLLAGLPWGVFRVVARRLYCDDSVEAAMETLARYSGFNVIRDVLDRHFFQRGELLRCFAVVSKILNLLYELEHDELAKYKESLNEQERDIEEFALYILTHPEFQTNPAGKKLQKFIRERRPKDSFPDLKERLRVITREFALIKESLNFTKDNYEGLQLIETYPDSLSAQEKNELFELFGLYPIKETATQKDYSARSIYWRITKENASSVARKRIAEIAETQCQRNVFLFSREGNE